METDVCSGGSAYSEHPRWFEEARLKAVARVTGRMKEHHWG
jgi:hypothetical protein